MSSSPDPDEIEQAPKRPEHASEEAHREHGRRHRRRRGRDADVPTRKSRGTSPPGWASSSDRLRRLISRLGSDCKLGTDVKDSSITQAPVRESSNRKSKRNGTAQLVVVTTLKTGKPGKGWRKSRGSGKDRNSPSEVFSIP